MAEQPTGADSIAQEDIIFECPHCGKSLAIEPRGAGMVIVCPDCQARVQVPGTPGDPFADVAASAAEAMQMIREENLDHYEEIGKELGLIQAALDRIVAIIQDAAAENAPSRR